LRDRNPVLAEWSQFPVLPTIIIDFAQKVVGAGDGLIGKGPASRARTKRKNSSGFAFSVSIPGSLSLHGPIDGHSKPQADPRKVSWTAQPLFHTLRRVYSRRFA
jgi:hypothetical protein